MDSELVRALFLLFVGTILGLLVEPIKKALGRPKRRGAYSVTRDAVIAVSDRVPEKLRGILDVGFGSNVFEYRVVAASTGSLSINNANLLITLPEHTELVSAEATTEPSRGVKHRALETTGKELWLGEVSLDRGQSVAVDLFVRSPDTDPQLEIEVSGGGDEVVWERTEAHHGFSLEYHFIAVVRNLILAEIVAAVIPGLAGLAGLLVQQTVQQTGPLPQYITFIVSSSGGQVLGSIGRLYFLLRIVPHAVALIRFFSSRRRVATV